MTSLLIRVAVGVPAALSFVLSLAAPPPVNAENAKKATLTGRLLDAETQEPLPFANVVFFRITGENPEGEPAGGTLVSAEGTFEAQIEPGNYRVQFSYIGYRKKEESVFAAPGETVRVETALEAEGFKVETVKVTAKAIQNAEGSMLARLREESAVNEAITAEQMSRTTDSNAADAVQRVTGISVVGGKYVFVRGLGERYSQTQINGTYVSSPEPNRRVVPLDLFPTGVLDNMIVQKTYTPDMPGDFAGGVLSLNTRDFAEKGQFRHSFSTSYNPSLGSVGSWTYDGGGRDWLGFDDGTRKLPDAVPDTGVPAGRTPDNPVIGSAFADTWTPRETSARPNYGYSGLWARPFKLFGKQAGALVSASLDNSFSSQERLENTWTGGSEPKRALDVQQGRHEVLGGLNGGFTMSLRNTDEIKVNLLYTRSAEDITNIKTGPDNNRGVYATRIEELGWVERGLLQTVLRGDHYLGLLRSRLAWNLSYSEADRDEPDRRQNLYSRQNEEDEFSIGGGGSFPFIRLFGKTADYTRTQRLDWTLPLGGSGEEIRSSLRLGYLQSTRDRTSSFRRFGFKYAAVRGEDPLDFTLPPEEFASRENVAKGFLLLSEWTQPDDAYVADQEIQAGYAMIDLPVFNWLRIAGGARYEENVQRIRAFSPIKPGDPGTTYIRKDFDLLPGINVTASPNRKHNIRLALSRTLNRPELRELAPFKWPDLEKGWEFQGNPNLEASQIKNVDLRWEVYPYPGEFLSLGVFYKRFDDPIITKGSTQAGGGAVEEPINADKAELFGFEGEVRLSFFNLYKALDWTLDFQGTEPPIGLLPWNIIVNYSRIESESEFSFGDGTPRTTPLKGQSDHAFNVGLFFQKSRFEGSLLYKQFGNRLDTVDRTVGLTRFEEPGKDLDIALAYRLSSSLSTKLKAKNLLDNEVVFFTESGGRITEAYERGRSFSLSLSYAPSGPEGE